MSDEEKKVIVKIDKAALEQFCRENNIEYRKDHVHMRSFTKDHRFQNTETIIRESLKHVFGTSEIYDRLKEHGLLRIEDIPTYTPCEKSGCSYKLYFGQEPYQCPGSDDEAYGSHHCVDCGELCSESAGSGCDLCGDWWCLDYQDKFVLFEHEYDDPREFEAVCMKCFITTPTLWCTDPECDCGARIEQVSRDWIEWNRRKMKLPPTPLETSKKRKTPE